VTVSNLYPRSIVPFVPEFHAKAQKNALTITKSTEKHLQNTFLSTFCFVMSNLFRTFAVENIEKIVKTKNNILS